jgi:oxygen-independent coproporphyrinogen-3 oxidase
MDLRWYGGDNNRSRALAQELVGLQPDGASGIVRRRGRHILVTEKGRPFVRLVAAAFDAYLPQIQRRHSVAV